MRLELFPDDLENKFQNLLCPTGKIEFSMFKPCAQAAILAAGRAFYFNAKFNETKVITAPADNLDKFRQPDGTIHFPLLDTMPEEEWGRLNGQQGRAPDVGVTPESQNKDYLAGDFP